MELVDEWRLRASRTALRSWAGRPLISRSIANSASIFAIASIAIGAFFSRAISKNLRRACAQQPTSMIGPGLRAAMQPVFGEQDVRQQARSRASARDRMERRRRLRDRLAGAAGELLPYMLDHLPLSARPSKPLRMSVWPVASQTRVPEGIGIVIANPPGAPRSPRSPSRHPPRR